MIQPPPPARAPVPPASQRDLSATIIMSTALHRFTAPATAPPRVASRVRDRSRARRASSVIARASEPDDESVEAIERRLKTRRGVPAGTAASSEVPRAANPSLGYLDNAARRNRVKPGANGQLAAWEADPAAWDERSAGERAWAVWTGEKGWMYWMNQASLYGAGGLAFFWVMFRFVGPAIGLYQLN